MTLPTIETKLPAIRPIPQYDEVGIPLLRKIWEEIKQDRSAWNQGLWIGQQRVEGTPLPLRADVIRYIEENQAPPWNCGTAYCMAGHAALAKGAKLTVAAIRSVGEHNGFDATEVVKPNGGVVGVSTYASEVLQLDSDQASVLFGGSNTAYDIEMFVEALEEDPNADLYQVEPWYDGHKRTDWLIKNGFLPKPHRAGSIRQAVEAEFSFLSDTVNEYYTLLILTHGEFIMPGYVYDADSLFHSNHDDYEETRPEWASGDVTTGVQAECEHRADILNEIARLWK